VYVVGIWYWAGADYFVEHRLAAHVGLKAVAGLKQLMDIKAASVWPAGMGKSGGWEGHGQGTCVPLPAAVLLPGLALQAKRVCNVMGSAPVA
jgi:hypothetical protein